MNKKLCISFLCFAIASCGGDESIGKIGNESVARQEYEAYLKSKRIPLNDSVKYQRALEQYLKRGALSVAVEKSGAFDQQLVDAEVEEYKRQLLINRYFERFLKDKASDEAVQNYYANNVAEFTSEKVKVAHILLRVDKSMSETERNVLLTSAHELHSRARAGESFEELAKAHSQDMVSAVKGGSLGWIQKGAVSEEFSAKAFAMQKGEVSDPFLTVFGFHILKIEEEKQTVKKPLEAVKGDIRYKLKNKAKQAEIDRLVTSIGYTIAEQE